MGVSLVVGLTLFLLPSLAAADVVISEVLADPPGDANRDGQYDPHEDEFIELYNTSSRSISLAGWRLGGAGPLSDYFRFPGGAAIAAGSYVVLFGGGNPVEFSIPIYTDDGAIGDGLTDGGEAIHLIDNHGHEVALLFQSSWPAAQSLVRTPSDGETLVPHQTASPTEAPFSPGYAPAGRPALLYNLYISEVLADPPWDDSGDANRDGYSHPYEDEFVELYNAGTTPVSLAGWRLGDAGALSQYFRFPLGAVIAPGSYVVLFGGGTPTGFAVPVYTDDGKIGSGLTNSGEAIHLIDTHGHEVASLFSSAWPVAQSLARTPSDGDTLVPHQAASRTQAPFSPGRALEKREPEPAVALTSIVQPRTSRRSGVLFISEILADPPLGPAGDANRDGRTDPYEDEFIELYNTGPDTLSLAGWRVGDSASLGAYFRFPPGAVIAPDSYAVLFGGGKPAGFDVPVYTDDGKIGDGLTDIGEAIYLIDDRGYPKARVSLLTWPAGQSIVRAALADSAWVPHKAASATQDPFSPGRAP